MNPVRVSSNAGGLAIFGLLQLLFLAVSGHTRLFSPVPTQAQLCRMGGENFVHNCPGPCPVVRGKALVDEENVGAIWARGDTVDVEWFRNGHQGGFARLSLVPVKDMMSKKAHDDFAIRFSCWQAGLTKCKTVTPQDCGSDKEGGLYKIPITVPDVYPDGLYVLGFSWYGGLDWMGIPENPRSYFGDYWSCSFVRISGGVEQSRQYDPIWVPGPDTRYPDSCLSSTDQLGECVKEPCRDLGGSRMVPKEFQNGQRPRTIRRSDFGDIEGSESDPESVVIEPESVPLNEVMVEEEDHETPSEPMTEPEAQPVADSETEPMTEPETELVTDETETEPMADPVTESETESEPGPETEADTKAEPKEEVDTPGTIIEEEDEDVSDEDTWNSDFFSMDIPQLPFSTSRLVHRLRGMMGLAAA